MIHPCCKGCITSHIEDALQEIETHAAHDGSPSAHSAEKTHRLPACPTLILVLPKPEGLMGTHGSGSWDARPVAPLAVAHVLRVLGHASACQEILERRGLHYL